MAVRIPLWRVLWFNNPSYEVVCEKSKLLMPVVGVEKDKGDPVHEALMDFLKALNSIPQVFIKSFEGAATCFTNSASMISCPSVRLGSRNSDSTQQRHGKWARGKLKYPSVQQVWPPNTTLLFIWIPLHLLDVQLQFTPSKTTQNLWKCIPYTEHQEYAIMSS